MANLRSLEKLAASLVTVAEDTAKAVKGFVIHKDGKPLVTIHGDVAEYLQMLQAGPEGLQKEWAQALSKALKHPDKDINLILEEMELAATKLEHGQEAALEALKEIRKALGITEKSAENGAVIAHVADGKAQELADYARSINSVLANAVSLGRAAMRDVAKLTDVVERFGANLMASGLESAIPRLGGHASLFPQNRKLVEAFAEMKNGLRNTADPVEAKACIEKFLSHPDLTAEERNAAGKLATALTGRSGKLTLDAVHGIARDAAKDAALEAKAGIHLHLPIFGMFGKINQAIDHVVSQIDKLAKRIDTIKKPADLAPALQDGLRVLEAAEGKATGTISVEELAKRLNVNGSELNQALAGELTDPVAMRKIQSGMRDWLQLSSAQGRSVKNQLTDHLRDLPNGYLSSEQAQFATEAMAAIDHMSASVPPPFGKSSNMKLVNTADPHYRALTSAAQGKYKAFEGSSTSELEGAAQAIVARPAPSSAKFTDKVQPKSSSLSGGHVAALAAAGAGGVVIGTAMNRDR